MRALSLLQWKDLTEVGKAMRKVVIGTGLLMAGAALGQASSHAEEFMGAMEAAMATMNRDMATAAMSDDVDRNFAAMMIPHHNGGIEMARAELQFGKDPVMRLNRRRSGKKPSDHGFIRFGRPSEP
jgi:hypothetical protein